MKSRLAMLAVAAVLIANNGLLVQAKKPAAPMSVAFVHQKEFTKTLSKGGECSYPDIPCQKNIELYMLTKDAKNIGDADEVWVNTDSLVQKFGSSEHKQGAKDFDAFLQKPVSALEAGQLLSDPIRVFDDGMEYESKLMGPVAGIDYPNTDKHQVVYSMDGQDFPGAVIVRVFARQNQTMLMMKGLVSDASQKQRIDKCYPEGVWPYTYKLTDVQEKEVEACYLKSVENDPDLQKAIHQKAQDLVSLFAIQPKTH